jgi:Holliday junction resolvase RusA-like endonuclease
MSAFVVSFSVPGTPQGKGRARAVRIGGMTRMATPPKTVAYEGLIAYAARQAMNGAQPMTGPVDLDVAIVMPIPGSWSARKREQALCGQILPCVKPDSDNVLKAIGDGCNGVLWDDDVQIIDTRLRKRYGAIPGVIVIATAMRIGVVNVDQARPARLAGMAP